jgi:hypothetical protein
VLVADAYPNRSICGLPTTYRAMAAWKPCTSSNADGPVSSTAL